MNRRKLISAVGMAIGAAGFTAAVPAAALPRISNPIKGADLPLPDRHNSGAMKSKNGSTVIDFNNGTLTLYVTRVLGHD